MYLLAIYFNSYPVKSIIFKFWHIIKEFICFLKHPSFVKNFVMIMIKLLFNQDNNECEEVWFFLKIMISNSKINKYNCLLFTKSIKLFLL